MGRGCEPVRESIAEVLQLLHTPDVAWGRSPEASERCTGHGKAPTALVDPHLTGGVADGRAVTCAGEFLGRPAAAAHTQPDLGKGSGGVRAPFQGAAPHRGPHLCGPARVRRLHTHHHGHHACGEAGSAASRCGFTFTQGRAIVVLPWKEADICAVDLYIAQPCYCLLRFC